MKEPWDSVKLKEASSVNDAIKYLELYTRPHIHHDYKDRIWEDCPDYNKNGDNMPCDDCCYMIDLKRHYLKEL